MSSTRQKRNFSVLGLLSCLLVSGFAESAAQDREWTLCETVTECAVALNPCAGLTGVNRKYIELYKNWSQTSPWGCPGYLSPGDSSTSRNEVTLARLSCEGTCEVRWVVDDRPVTKDEVPKVSEWKPYIENARRRR